MVAKEDLVEKREAQSIKGAMGVCILGRVCMFGGILLHTKSLYSLLEITAKV